MKVSIVTAVFNGADTIEDSMRSTCGQTYTNIEHIVIDGGSTDGTLDIIRKYRHKIAKLVSEPDNGIYGAMNKGIRNATGDIIGILNSDDLYVDENVIGDVVNAISENNVDSCYGDLLYVERKDTNEIVRVWNSGVYDRESFRKGWMPPHPTFFVKRSIYEKYGFFNTDFRIAADYELMLRFLYRYNVSTAYIPRVLVKMRTGGKSRPDVIRVAKNMIENYRAWKVNGLKPNPTTFVLKPLSKAVQYIKAK